MTLPLRGFRRASEYQDTITGKDGRRVTRKWAVFPSPSDGFGTSQVLDTLFEVFQLWKEQGFRSRVIQFESLYSLLKRKGLKQDTEPAYDRLKKDLDALVTNGASLTSP